MAEREEFVIDTAALSGDRRAEAIRFVLRLLESDASTFESDVPLANQERWPQVVREAAAVLSNVRPQRRGANGDYQQTGVQQRSAEPVWHALTVFAPYAFDARVWDADGRTLIHVADEGTSSVARLTAEQARSISLDQSVAVIRLKEWRRSRH